jgi:PAS domain-containing protein
MPEMNEKGPIDERGFSRRFLWLIFLAWNLPPVVGFGFLIYIQMFSLEQVLGVMSQPWEPSFITVWAVGSLLYFHRFQRPIRRYLKESRPTPEVENAYLGRLHQFPLHFWGLFIAYLLLAPSGVIISAELATDFRATPVDWFRIHLVALVVSIIVGLPLFFKQMDLFGLTLRSTHLQRPIVSIKTKVFLLGALMPLLVDTMLVQYYWTRTGYFSYEAFGVWFMLELLAIGGTLIYLHSLRQSFSPLEEAIALGKPLSRVSVSLLTPQSTDELGTLAGKYQVLVRNTQAHNQLVKTSAGLIVHAGVPAIGKVLETMVNTCREAIGGDKVFLILHDGETGELVGVAQTGEGYREEGFFRLEMDETSMAVSVFRNASTIAIDDCMSDDRVSSQMRQRFKIQSAIGTPLISGGINIGVLMSVSIGQAYEYTQEEKQLMEGIAGEAALVITTHRLMRNREKTERILQQLNQRNELLLESTSEGIIGVDNELRCTFVNRAAASLLGYTQRELTGRDIHKLIHFRSEDQEPLSRQQLPLYQAISQGI